MQISGALSFEMQYHKRRKKIPENGRRKNYLFPYKNTIKENVQKKFYSAYH